MFYCGRARDFMSRIRGAVDLQRWNIAGMVVFKFASIGTAIAIGEFVERRRPGWGKFVLLVGCAAAAAAFWHGLRLYLGFDPMSWIEDG